MLNGCNCSIHTYSTDYCGEEEIYTRWNAYPCLFFVELPGDVR